MTLLTSLQRLRDVLANLSDVIETEDPEVHKRLRGGYFAGRNVSRGCGSTGCGALILQNF